MKKLLIFIATILSSFLFTSAVNANTPSFTIYPIDGEVVVGETFTVDILIDSSGEELVEARAVLLFDPDLVELVNPEFNASLFCTYPSNQQSVDNTYGVVMITGFCQPGVGSPYVTEGGADVFARIEFEVLDEGEIVLDWNYSGSNQEFMSILMKNGSPPSNVLSATPQEAVFIASGDGNGIPDDGEFPDTALNPGTWIIIIGLALILLGTMYLILGRRSKSKMRTVVLYE